MNDNHDNVVTFGGNPKLQQSEGEEGNKPEAERMLLVCVRCSCRTWNLMCDGTIECANCDNTVSHDRTDPADLDWRRITQTAPSDPEVIAKLPDDGGTISSVSTGDTNFARTRVFKKTERWFKENKIAMLICYHEDGEGSSWFNSEDEEGVERFVEKLEDLIHNLKSKYATVET